MHRQQGIAAAAALVLALVAWQGCGDLVCGKGTVEVNGECQPGVLLECGPGYVALGDSCVPDSDVYKGFCDPATTTWDPTTGECVGIVPPAEGPCPRKCPPVSGSKICLQGRVLHAPALMASWTGDDACSNPAPVTTTKDRAVVRVYDPIDFVTNPSWAMHLVEAAIDDNGCFMVENVSIPFSNLFAIAVVDELPSGTTWAFAATGEVPTVGRNSMGLQILALSEQEVASWGHDLLAAGASVAVFRDKLTGLGVEGVVPIFDGPGEAFFFAHDPATCTVLIDPNATATTKTGAVAIRNFKNFLGFTKPGCTIESIESGGKSKLGGSSPGTIFFSFFDVEGC
jgi:hypothetical protein